MNWTYVQPRPVDSSQERGAPKLDLRWAGVLRRLCLPAIVPLTLISLACSGQGRPLFAPSATPPSPSGDAAPESADTGFTAADVPTLAETPAPLTSIDIELRVMKVQLPRRDRQETEALWKHLREDVVDGETALRLRRNGIRVGIGRDNWWSPVKAVLDAVPSRRVDTLDDVRIPPGYPLSLELDAESHEQTLFYIGDDGILSGSTWPSSRNVLRLLYAVDERHRGRVHLQVMPEVRQRLSGLRYMRTDAGVWQVPKGGGREFPAAGFSVRLDPDEFLLLAPSDRADIGSTIGGAFLTEEGDGQRFDTLLFIRPELTNVGQRSE